MNRDSLDKNLMVMGSTFAVFVLFLLAYYLPRTHSLKTTEESIVRLQGLREEVSVLLPELVRTAPRTPLPTPDVRSWIASNCLVGLEKNLVANDGAGKGRGALVKLRKLTPEQTAQFLSSLTRVRLSVERLLLQDSDTDGYWDLEIGLQVPE